MGFGAGAHAEALSGLAFSGWRLIWGPGSLQAYANQLEPCLTVCRRVYGAGECSRGTGKRETPSARPVFDIWRWDSFLDASTCCTLCSILISIDFRSLHLKEHFTKNVNKISRIVTEFLFKLWNIDMLKLFFNVNCGREGVFAPVQILSALISALYGWQWD